MSMDKKELIILFNSIESPNRGASVLKIEHLLCVEGVYASSDLVHLLQEHFPNKKDGNFDNFDEFKNFIEFLCLRLKKTTYKIVPLAQYNNDQSELDTSEKFQEYFRSLKSFPLNTDMKDKKGLFGRFLSF